MDLRGLGAVGRVHDGALLHLGDLARHADDNARVHHHLAVVRLVDEVVQHLLGLPEVRDDAVLHGLDRDDVAGRAAEHLLGFLADGLDLVGVAVDRDDRRLVDDDAFATGKHERVRGAQVDRQIA